MFSPAEPNLVAGAGCGGTQLLELRQYGPVRYLSIYLHYLLKFNKTYFPLELDAVIHILLLPRLMRLSTRKVHDYFAEKRTKIRVKL